MSAPKPTPSGPVLELRAAAIRRLHSVPCASCRARTGAPCQPVVPRDAPLADLVHEPRLVAALLADPASAVERQIRAARIHRGEP